MSFVYGGYAGKILRVNLTSGDIKKEELDQQMASKFLGGNGLAAHFLYHELAPGIDPLGPENKVLIFTGPVAGTILPLCSRVGVFSKSPLTGLFFDSYAGGNFAPELKFAGYDGIIIEGEAKSPVYLWIDDDNVSLRPAESIWGRYTYATQNAIKKDLGDESIQVGCIGPAGEKLSRIAGVFFGVRAAGRGGLGAVLGAKKLKAIAVRGSKDITVSDLNGLIKLTGEILEIIRKHPVAGKSYYEYGTTPNMASNNMAGILGTRNWQVEEFEGTSRIDGDAMRQKTLIKSKACYNCPMMCGKLCLVKDGPYKGALTEGPEYETLFSLGSLCGIDSLEAITLGDRLCDELGFDSISAGAAIAFAMECFEKGIVNRNDTDGLELNFGNHEAMIALLEKMAKREGLGDILAEGTARAAIRLGAESLAIHMRGLEPAGHSARGLKGMGLGYAVSTRGGSHHDPRPKGEYSGQIDRRTPSGKGEYVAKINNMTALEDSMIMCHMAENFLGFFDLTEMHVKAINSVTGIGYDLNDVRKLGERVWNLERAFNVREGVRRENDTLPNRFLTEPIPSGPSQGLYITPEVLEKMKDDYYQIRGWDLKTGIPKEAKLRELGLEDVIMDLWG
ncbi:aldehyde ferredoxin oxidoreductase family protein [Neomoorella mulderi]|uniref:Putative oxidoreductase YdhV n=1 Tax=Moorella mulderi DSM 14980 TaxID=1122241 RepID=A0A151AW57_9FIRM|nr:aldehyde ferredoxin oxidoreductase family protein [Moorella mulderi]KYH31793.1 putative oxidoreductase YdhV [Moorella mulderi DSM 14980]